MSETICYCKDVDKDTIVDAIKNGAKTLKDIQEKTSACTGNKCKELNPKRRCCSVEINEILEKELGEKSNCSCNGCC